jgi:hypothetical protein
MNAATYRLCKGSEIYAEDQLRWPQVPRQARRREVRHRHPGNRSCGLDDMDDDMRFSNKHIKL